MLIFNKNITINNNITIIHRNIIHIISKDVYEDFSSNEQMFDYSNYLTKSKYRDNPDKLVIWKLKDETEGVTIESCIGLKPRMYSFLVDDDELKKSKRRE